jgi:hypothetical protein
MGRGAAVQLFALLGVSIYCLASLVVGARLLLLARRTGERPELLIGMAFVTGGTAGYTLTVASIQLQDSTPELSRTLYYLGMLMLVSGAGCLYRFWQRVYHPGNAKAAALCYAAILAMFVALAAQWATTTASSNLPESNWYRFQLFVQTGAYAINVFANGRFYRTLQRRVAIGLADPIVANRVMLWAAGSAVVVVQYSYTIALVLMAAPGERAAANPAIISALGIAVSVLIVLAFFPPPVYRRFIAERAPVER